MTADTTPEGPPPRDMALYQRLITRGIAEADARGSAIDHVTARRMALWLLPRVQEEPDFMRGLIHFARTGGITKDLRAQLRRHARSPGPYRSHTARLVQYAHARGTDLGRIGDHFGAVCDQIDQADAILEERRERVLESRSHRGQETTDWQSRFTLRPAALARRDNVTHAVTFILDGEVAEAAVNAITADAMEREARIRQIRQESAQLSEGSYGRRNREAMITREATIVGGLLAVARAYQAAVEPVPAPELSQILLADTALDREVELE